MGKRSRGSVGRRLTKQQQLRELDAAQVQVPGQMPLLDDAPAPAIAGDPEKGRPFRSARAEVERLAARAVVARGRAEAAELAAVRLGRAEGWSWDRVGRLMACSGETLRRRYVAALVVDEDQVLEVDR